MSAVSPGGAIPRWRRPRRAGLLAAAVVAGVILAACSGPEVAIPPAVSVAGPAIPLANATVGASGSWATVAMGHLDDPLNTFWELFHLTGSPVRWTLATPEGVASNGGVVTATGSSGSLLAGFEPTNALHFSPVALTVDGGSNWTTAVLPGGLERVPQALATGGPGYLALLPADGGTVVGTGGDLSTWRTVATARTIEATGGASGCHLSSLTAVASLANGDPVVGGTCASGHRAAIVVDEGGRWTPTGPTLSTDPGGSIRVVRLVGTGTGAMALISAGTGRHPVLFAAWSTDDLTSWSVSPPLSTVGSTLESSGTTPTQGLVVQLEEAGGAGKAVVIEPSTMAWDTLAPLPQRTAVVAAIPGGGFDALIVRQGTLTVEALGAGGWTQAQTLQVPIPYGSSA